MSAICSTCEGELAWDGTCNGCALDAARAEITRLREQAEALAGALQDLFDEQNGPPLLKDAESWQAAWDKSDAALAAYRAQEGGQ